MGEDPWTSMARAEEFLQLGSDPSHQAYEEATAALEAAIKHGGADPAVNLVASLALAQLIGSQALNVETEKLSHALDLTRSAIRAAEELGQPEPHYSAACSLLGCLLMRISDRLPEDLRNESINEATRVLEVARNLTNEMDPTWVVRQANLAAALQAPLRDLDLEQEMGRLDLASEAYAQLLQRGLADDHVAAVLGMAAHVDQRRASLARRRGDPVAAQRAFDRAERRYRESIDTGQKLGQQVGGAQMGLARLKFEAAEHSGSDSQLDEAITLGVLAVRHLDGDIGFEREAQMQLAVQFEARLRRHHRPSDAAEADRLSELALNSWYHEPDSIELTRAQERRVDVLRSVALSAIGTDAHIIELDALLRRLYPDQKTPQMAAISEMAAIARAVSGTAPKSADATYAELVEHASAFESILEENDFVLEDPAWWVRWFSAHKRIAEWSEWVGLEASDWLGPLIEASSRMERRMSAEFAGTEAFAISRIQLAEVSKAIGIVQRDETFLRTALGHLTAALEASDVLSPHHRIKLGTEGCFVCELLGDDSASKWIRISQLAAQELSHTAGAPLAARFAVDRERYELAGSAAALGDGPQSVAWTLHSTIHAPNADEDARNAFIADLEEVSASVTVVFIAQSRRRCRASIVRNARWQLLNLPNLALDQLGSSIRSAHEAHSELGSGEITARTTWHAANADLLRQLEAALAPLFEALADETRPVAVRLSGWLHAVPVTPILAAGTGSRVPIGLSLGMPRGQSRSAPRSRRLAALAAPGDGIRARRLENAVDDVVTVCRAFGEEYPVVEATVADATAALQDAQIVLFAAHGASAHQPENSRLTMSDGDLTAADVAGLELSGLDLAVVAACEALSIDRSSPGHPFNVQFALIAAGATMACGPHWQIDDDVASFFTRKMLSQVAVGERPAEAYRIALAATQAKWPDQRDLTLLVDSERSMAR